MVMNFKDMAWVKFKVHKKKEIFSLKEAPFGSSYFFSKLRATFCHHFYNRDMISILCGTYSIDKRIQEKIVWLLIKHSFKYKKVAFHIHSVTCTQWTRTQWPLVSGHVPVDPNI